MITFKNTTKRYSNGQVALNQINCNIETGEFVFLTGHSGAGKSTFLKLIAKLETPSRGDVIVDSIPLNTLTPRRIPFYRRQLGLILQDPNLLPELTCFDNVALPLQIMHTDPDVIQKRVRAALDKVGLLAKAQCYPQMLSTGEQQRINIARAVVHRPKILLADEPTGNLDPALSFEIFKLFARFHQIGVTLIIATHDTLLLNAFPYRQLILSNGELIQDESQVQAAS